MRVLYSIQFILDWRNAMLNQVTINSNTYSGFTLEEALKGASAAGFTKI